MYFEFTIMLLFLSPGYLWHFKTDQEIQQYLEKKKIVNLTVQQVFIYTREDFNPFPSPGALSFIK